ncbi:MAG TPA: hypothetical protein VF829_00895 [Candidatus Paceibacterota bacterium]
MTQAAFIVLDGNDGSGKATQAEMLKERLEREGITCLKLDFPGYERTVFGGLVGECLAGKHGDFLNLDAKIASSLYALDRFESSALIRDKLKNGGVVIADRFASANQIHQGGKIKDEADRIDFLAWLDHIEHEVLGIPRPDRIIYLDVPVDVSLRLLGEKRARKNQHVGDSDVDTVESDRQYLERSHATAEWLVAHQPNWARVDCMENGELRSREAIHADIMRNVSAVVG